MLERLKGVMTVRDEMDTLQAEVKELTSTVEKIGELMHGETVRLRELHNTQSDMISTFLQATQALNRLKEDLRKELEDFRMLNRQTQSKMLDQFEQELRNSLTINTKALELDKHQYEKVKNEVTKFGEMLTSLNFEINKLLIVCQHLKAQDFSLTETHKKMLEEDKHKLSLIQRIDELERMLAKMKQGRARSKV